MKQLALIDLDNTLANYAGAMRQWLELLQSPSDLPLPADLHDGIPYLDARMDLIKCYPGFWEDLAPIPLGFAVLEEIRSAGFRLNVLSRGPRTKPNAWTEKMRWCLRHVPDAKVTLTTEEKSGNYGRILFDDWPRYFEPWLDKRPRGQVIMLDHPWNQQVTHPRVTRIKSYADLTILRELLPEVHARRLVT